MYGEIAVFMDVYMFISHDELLMSSCICVDVFWDLQSGITSQRFLEVSESARPFPALKVWPSQVLDHLTHNLSIGVPSVNLEALHCTLTSLHPNQLALSLSCWGPIPQRHIP